MKKQKRFISTVLLSQSRRRRTFAAVVYCCEPIKAFSRTNA
jgi:hypothetical protein